jgi:HTH-type transcriptional regulator / antitoxin HigA
MVYGEDSAKIIKPGDYLKDELEARGWTQNDLAAIMGRPPQAISEIIRGTKQITPETAIELALAFDTDWDLWSNLENNYRFELAKLKAEKKGSGDEIVRKRRLYSIAPIGEITKRGWIKEKTSFEELERDVCSFLQIKSLDEEPKISFGSDGATSFNFRRGPITKEVNWIAAWLRRVEQLAKDQPVGVFDPSKLEEKLPEILSLTSEPEKVANLPGILLDLGIHFVLVKHLSKTYIDGVKFQLGNNPVIGLSLRYDRIDAFWFTFFHELAHVFLQHSGISLDSLDVKDEEGSIGIEVEANDLAQKWLVNDEAYKSFVKEHNPYFSQIRIVEFAHKQARHPGIVLGRLQYDKYVGYNQLRSLLVKVSPYLEDWIDVPYPSEFARKSG